jgi:hypothetical protein
MGEDDDLLDECGTRNGFDKMSAYRKDGKPRKRNRYPARCKWCGKPLGAEEGVISYSEKNDEWSVSCAEELW